MLLTILSMLRMVTSGMMRKSNKYLSYLDTDNRNGARKGAVFFLNVEVNFSCGIFLRLNRNKNLEKRKKICIFATDKIS